MDQIPNEDVVMHQTPNDDTEFIRGCQPIFSIPEELVDRVQPIERDYKVVTVAVVGMKAKANEPIRPLDRETHWLIYLNISRTRSFRINMRCYSNKPVTTFHHSALDWEFCDPVPDSAAPVITFQALGRCCVGEIIDLIRTTYLQVYLLPKEGNGCRWWVYCVIGQLSSASYVQDDATDHVNHHLFWHWPREDPPAINKELSIGVFPAVPDWPTEKEREEIFVQWHTLRMQQGRGAAARRHAARLEIADEGVLAQMEPL